MFMILYAEFLVDDLGNALARPQVARKPKGFGTLFQQGQQLLALLWLQFRRCSTRSPFLQAAKAVRLSQAHDLAHPPLTHAQRIGDGLLRPPLLMQFQRSIPSSFSPILRGGGLLCLLVLYVFHAASLASLALITNLCVYQ